MLSISCRHVRPHGMAVANDYVVLYRSSEHLLPTRLHHATPAQYDGILKSASPYSCWALEVSHGSLREAKPGGYNADCEEAINVGVGLSASEQSGTVIYWPEPGARVWASGVGHRNGYFTEHTFGINERHRFGNRRAAFIPPTAISAPTHLLWKDKKIVAASRRSSPNDLVDYSRGDTQSIFGWSNYARVRIPRRDEPVYALSTVGLLEGHKEAEVYLELPDNTSAMDFDFSPDMDWLAVACVSDSFALQSYQFESWRYWNTNHPGGVCIAMYRMLPGGPELRHRYDIPAIYLGFNPNGTALWSYSFAGGDSNKTKANLIALDVFN